MVHEEDCVVVAVVVGCNRMADSAGVATRAAWSNHSHSSSLIVVVSASSSLLLLLLLPLFLMTTGWRNWTPISWTTSARAVVTSSFDKPLTKTAQQAKAASKLKRVSSPRAAVASALLKLEGSDDDEAEANERRPTNNNINPRHPRTMDPVSEMIHTKIASSVEVVFVTSASLDSENRTEGLLDDSKLLGELLLFMDNRVVIRVCLLGQLAAVPVQPKVCMWKDDLATKQLPYPENPSVVL